MPPNRATETTAHAPYARETIRLVAFRPVPGRSTPPRQPFAHRLARAGLAIASHVVDSQSGTADDGHAVHAGTVVAILATLAAEAGLAAAAVNRRVSLDVAPGGWVRGGVADTILFQGVDNGSLTTVWDLVAASASEAGVPADAVPDLDAVLARAEAGVGTKPYPVLTVPPGARPRSIVRAAAARQRHAAHAYAADEGLCTPHEQALALGAAIAQVVRTEPDPAVLTQLAAEMLVGASRLAPMPFALG